MIIASTFRRKPTVDPRIAELLALAAEEHITLPMPIDTILWLEDRGVVVELLTGESGPPIVGTPTGLGTVMAYRLAHAGGEL